MNHRDRDDREVELAEIDVEVLAIQEDGILVTDGDFEVVIPFNKIDKESEINGYSEIGETGVLLIPQGLAEDLELV